MANPLRPPAPTRRPDSLSRERIVEASIALLDGGGEAGLTFRALAERLATGPGAIYWHIASKGDLLTAACDAIVARATGAPAPGATPAATIRGLALDLFEAIDAHPWVGAALAQAPGALPVVRILDRLGQQVRAMRVAPDAEWAAVATLFSYILGVSGQNAANTQMAQSRRYERTGFLASIAAEWARLDEGTYPFVRSVADQLPTHDDRADFLAGIDLILGGLAANQAPPTPCMVGQGG